MMLFLLFAGISDTLAKKSSADSLIQELNRPAADSVRINICFQIGDLLRNSNHDSALYYYNMAYQLSASAMKKDAGNREKYLLHQASSMRMKGLVCFLNKENDRALDYFQTALKMFKGLVVSKDNLIAEEGKRGMAKCFGNFGAVAKDQGKYEEAIKYFDKAIQMGNETGDKKTLSVAYNNKGITYYYLGDYEKSVENYSLAAGIFEETGDLQSNSAALANIGLVYTAQGYYTKSVESYMKSLTILEKIGDPVGISSTYNNIGIVYYEQKSYDKSLEYYKKALNITEKEDVIYISASIHTNIGNVYSDLNEYDEALDHYYKALYIRDELKDDYSISGLYNNIGLIHYYKKDYPAALQYYSKSFTISQALSDKSSMAKVLGNLSALYVRLAEIESGDREMYLKRAVDAGQRSYDIAMEIGAIPVQNTTAGQLQRAYTIMGKYKEALQFAEVVIITKDSMFSDEKMHVMAEINAKYETERQELEIENLNKENKLRTVQLEKSEAQRSKQRLLIYTFIVGLVAVIFFSVMLFRLFLQKKKANVLLARQKEQIESKNTLLEQANEEIHAQKDEIEAQRDMVIRQKTYIEEQQKEIVDSINYARRIQFAVLPTGIRAEKMLGTHFIFFRPRDVVSGDFYWVSKIRNYLVVAVADCTGHGVPGAFMSMMGISLLNEIVRKEEVRNAGDVLNHLRHLLVESLNQESGLQPGEGEMISNYQSARELTTSSEIVLKDGMDISLAVINTDTLICHWAGAYNPLYIVTGCSSLVTGDANQQPATSNQKPATSTQKLIELKGDKMPIALHYKMHDFTNHEIQLSKGDRIYLFTDGYYDQFGGSKGRKMGLKVFKDLLFETSNYSIQKQGECVAEFFEQWINNQSRYNQVDDITVLGIEI